MRYNIILLVIGFFAVLLAYYYYNMRHTEKFDTGTAPSAAPAASGAAASGTAASGAAASGATASGTAASSTAASSKAASGTAASGKAASGKAASGAASAVAMPQQNAIDVYINAFQDVDGHIPSYVPGASRWLDAVKDNTFQIVGGSPPVQLGQNGFNLLNFTLVGPPSNVISQSALSKFTVALYMNMNSFTSVYTGSIVKIAQIYCESPNFIIFTITPAASTDTVSSPNVSINAHVGVNVYQWVIPKTSLTTTTLSSTPLVTFVFDAVVSTGATATSVGTTGGGVSLYINGTSYGTPTPSVDSSTSADTGISTSTNTQIILGNSQIRINGNNNIDANMYAFAIFSSAFGQSDINTLATYFSQQISGYNNLLLQQQLAQKKQHELSNTVTSFQSQLTDYKSQLAQCQATNSSMVEAANASTISDATTSAKMWQVQLGKYSDPKSPITDSMLASCSPLSVNKFGTSTDSPVPASKTSTDSPVPAPGGGPFSIPYPSASVSSAISPAPTSPTPSTSASSTSASSASSSTTSSTTTPAPASASESTSASTKSKNPVTLNNFPQVGNVVYNDGKNAPVVLPLYGKVLSNGNRWQYYCAYNSAQFPVSYAYTGSDSGDTSLRDCSKDFGCYEIHNGDKVVVPDYNNATFVAQITTSQPSKTTYTSFW